MALPASNVMQAACQASGTYSVRNLGVRSPILETPLFQTQQGDSPCLLYHFALQVEGRLEPRSERRLLDMWVTSLQSSLL